MGKIILIILSTLLVLALIFGFVYDNKDGFLRVQKIRNDAKGSGYYLAKRGARKHYGVDFLVSEKENIYAPENGVLKGVRYPNKNDYSYSGFEFLGDSGTVYKVYYNIPDYDKVGKRVRKGSKIAIAQDISKKYGGEMKPHIHVETYLNGLNVNPENILKIRN